MPAIKIKDLLNSEADNQLDANSFVSLLDTYVEALGHSFDYLKLNGWHSLETATASTTHIVNAVSDLSRSLEMHLADVNVDNKAELHGVYSCVDRVNSVVGSYESLLKKALIGGGSLDTFRVLLFTVKLIKNQSGDLKLAVSEAFEMEKMPAQGKIKLEKTITHHIAAHALSPLIEIEKQILSGDIKGKELEQLPDSTVSNGFRATNQNDDGAVKVTLGTLLKYKKGFMEFKRFIEANEESLGTLVSLVDGEGVVPISREKAVYHTDKIKVQGGLKHSFQLPELMLEYCGHLHLMIDVVDSIADARSKIPECKHDKSQAKLYVLSTNMKAMRYAFERDGYEKLNREREFHLINMQTTYANVASAFTLLDEMSPNMIEPLRDVDSITGEEQRAIDLAVGSSGIKSYLVGELAKAMYTTDDVIERVIERS